MNFYNYLLQFYVLIILSHTSMSIKTHKVAFALLLVLFCIYVNFISTHKIPLSSILLK